LLGEKNVYQPKLSGGFSFEVCSVHSRISLEPPILDNLSKFAALFIKKRARTAHMGGSEMNIGMSFVCQNKIGEAGGTLERC